MLEPSSSEMLGLNTKIKCVTILGYIRKSGFKLIHHRMYVLKSLRLRLILFDPPGSSVHGMLQATILEYGQFT